MILILESATEIRQKKGSILNAREHGGGGERKASEREDVSEEVGRSSWLSQKCAIIHYLENFCWKAGKPAASIQLCRVEGLVPFSALYHLDRD